MQPEQFVQALAGLEFENTFNPYTDTCAVHDLTSAPVMRAEVLRSVLEAATLSELDAIWIGRDLGYRGGRRTGLALTDDVHIHAHAQRWGVTADRPTSGEAIAERTAAFVWKLLSKISAPIFLWNVFPLHPHEPENPFSNRTHNARERKAGQEVLWQLILLLQPRRLVAIGNDAANVAGKFRTGTEVMRVRHPSYGGQSQFASEVCALYGVHSV